TTTGAVTRTITGDVTDTITGAITHTVTGATTSTLDGTLTKTVTGAVTVNAEAGVTVTTPSWTLNNTGPTAFWQSSYARGTPARFTVTGLAADVWGLRGQAYVLNLQYAVAKLDFFDFKNDNGQIELTQKLVKISGTAAAKISTGGLNLYTKVMNIFM